ncbi:MAG: alanine--tRNA ligase, partial [Actinobacteria bacterium]|nr:alanine--tRNA ligase [Actinomycetota bacterium]
ESSIGAGVRRVEALVGVDAYQFLAREHILLNSLTSIIKGARVEELPERISDLLTKIRDIEKELSAVRSAAAFAQIDAISKASTVINSVTTTVAVLSDGISGDDLRTIALELRAKATNSVVALISVNDGKPVLVVAASDAARAQGVNAGALVKIASAVLGGGGGGKDDFAQGGGTDITALNQALSAICEALKG